MTFAIAAAGTGGHVYPALAVAEALLGRGVARDEIVFLGGDRMEATVVPAAGYPFHQLEIRGIRRSLSKENLTLPFAVRKAARSSGEAMDRAETTAVAVFGGYVTGPAVMAARKRRIPIVVHEQNAVPGLANKLATRFAARTFVAFGAASDVLRHGEVVGNPLRAEIAHFDRAQLRDAALQHFGLGGSRPILGIFGGSLGAQALNDCVVTILGSEDMAVDVLHLTGRGHFDAIRDASRSDERWTPVAYETRMDLFYAASDLVVSRAGALTVSELAVTGTPAIIVPLPAGKGYQDRNADDLSLSGGAVVIRQERIDEVPAAVNRILGDAEDRARMAKAAESVGHPEAAGVVADALLEVARAA